MDAGELKEILKDVKDDTPIVFSTFSMYITENIGIRFEEADGRWYDKDTVVITAENI